MQTLILRYVPEAADIMDIAVRSPRLRRLRNQAVAGSGASLAVTVLCGALGAHFHDQQPYTSLIALVCGLMFMSQSYRAIALSSRWRLRRNVRRAWNRWPSSSQPHEGVIAPEALSVRAGGITRTYDWSVFSELVESERQFVLRDRSDKPAVALPKRGLSEPSLIADCRRLLTGYIAAAQPSGPTVRADAGARAS